MLRTAALISRLIVGGINCADHRHFMVNQTNLLLFGHRARGSHVAADVVLFFAEPLHAAAAKNSEASG
jgi:hypothetical protein